MIRSAPEKRRTTGRARLAGVIGSVLVAGLLVASGGSALAATGPADGATFTVTGVGSGKNLDVPGGSQADGVQVIQYTANGNANQRWTTRSAGGGGYTVVNANSGKCLTVGGGSTTNGAPVVQRTCDGAAEQTWTFSTTSGGVSTLTATVSGRCLDVTARSTADGALIEQYTCNGGTNQQWLLNPVGATTGARVGSWAAAVNPTTTAFTNQTVRLAVHTSTGGASPRVRLSNLFGGSAMNVGHVDLAVRSSGGTAVAGTHHRVTFGGAGTVTVAAGTERTSDPVDMTVAADRDLLVSIYVANAVTSSTWHSDALGTGSYISTSGNHAAEDGAANYPTARNSWYLLSGIDLVSATATGTVVAFGDSITDGARSTANANRRYPDYLARRLVAAAGGPKLSVVNAGIGGNQVLRDAGSSFGFSALNRFSRDALGQPGVKSVILLEGINDIRDRSAPTAQQITDGYRVLIGKAHAAGVAIYGGTLVPAGGTSGYTAAHESVRTAVNTWIRTSGAFDGVIDFDAAVRDPGAPTRMLPAYDSGDHLHPGNAGYQAMANAVNLSALGS